MSLLRTEELTKSFSRRKVVDGVYCRVEQGEIVGLLGPNGAGKTTAFRMTIGMIPADSGRVFFEEQEVTDLPMYKRARLGMGYLSQDPSVFQKLTVRDNVLAILETIKIPGKERLRRLDALLGQLGITHLAEARAYALSGGERRRLEIARALVTEPRLLLLDEPFTGVDPIAVGEIHEIILGLREQGMAVLLTDHNVHDTLSITDRAYILNKGKIEASGTAEELLNNPRARELYLGDRFSIEHIRRPSGRRPADQPTARTERSENGGQHGAGEE